MVAEKIPVSIACRVLAVSESGYERLKRTPSERAVRHTWLTDLITQVHIEARGIYGARRVHAELTLGRGIVVGHGQVELLMQRAGLRGVTGRPKWKRNKRLHRLRQGQRCIRPDRPEPALGHRHRAPRGAVEPSGGERPAPPCCRSSTVKLRAA